MTVLQQLLQPLWEISSEPIAITGNEQNPDGRSILYINQAYTDMTGYSSQETIGRSSSLLHGQDTDIVRTSEAQLQNGRLQEYVLRHYRKDGSSYRCAITTAPHVDLDGTSEYLISMYRTMPERSSRAANNDPKKTSVPLTIPMPLIEYPGGDLPTQFAVPSRVGSADGALARSAHFGSTSQPGGLHIGRHDAMGDPPLDCSGVT